MTLRTEFDLSSSSVIKDLTETERDIIAISRAGKKDLLEEQDFSTKRAKAFLEKHKSVAPLTFENRVRWARSEFLKSLVSNKLPSLSEPKKAEVINTISQSVATLSLKECAELVDKIKKLVESPFGASLDQSNLMATIKAISVISDAIAVDRKLRRQHKPGLVPLKLTPFLENVFNALIAGSLRIRHNAELSKYEALAIFLPVEHGDHSGVFGFIEVGDYKTLDPDILLHESIHAAQYLNGSSELQIDEELEAYTAEFGYLLATQPYTALEQKLEDAVKKTPQSKEESKSVDEISKFLKFVDSEFSKRVGNVTVFTLHIDALRCAKVIYEDTRPAKVAEARQKFREKIAFFNAHRALKATYEYLKECILTVAPMVGTQERRSLMFDAIKTKFSKEKQTATSESAKLNFDLELAWTEAFRELILYNNTERPRKIATDKLIPLAIEFAEKQRH